MSTKVAPQPSTAHPVLPDIGRPVMAKADVRTPDIDWLAAIGKAIQQAVRQTPWSNKEAACRVGTDDAEFGKWLNGTRRPHFDRLFAVKELRAPLLVALAQLEERVEITTVISIKKVA